MIVVDRFLNTVTLSDVLEFLPQLPDNSVHCIVTSPPYWAVRDYKIPPTHWPEVTYSIFGFEITVPAQTCQLGHEIKPEHFVGHMVYVFRQARRVLRNEGTLWMNMGDCYNSKSGGYQGAHQQGMHQPIAIGTKLATLKINRNSRTLKPKDMVGIPWMLAFAMRDDGWYLRQDIIWHKRNPMPESVADRCTKAHEYVFLFSKKQKYYYDGYAIATEITDASVARYNQNLEKQNGSDRAAGGAKHNGNMKAAPPKHKMPGNWHQSKDYHNQDPRYNFENRKARREEENNYGINGKGFQGHNGYFDKEGNLIGSGRANKKSVWTITNKGTSVDHFATYPEELVVDPIKAGTSEHGCCEKCGSPWKRTYDKVLVPGVKAAKTFVVDQRDHDADKNDHGSNLQKDGHKSGHHYQYSNVKWAPTCKCHGKFKKLPFFRMEEVEGKLIRVKHRKKIYFPSIPLEDHPVKPCIVLDIFAGYNTTGIMARKLHRNYYACEKSENYKNLSDERTYRELGMFA